MIRCFVSTMTYLLPKKTVHARELSLPQTQNNAWAFVYRVLVKLISVSKDPQGLGSTRSQLQTVPFSQVKNTRVYLEPAVVEDGKIFTDAYPKGYVTETDFDDRDKVKKLMKDLRRLSNDIPALKTFLTMQPASTKEIRVLSRLTISEI